MKIMIEVDTDRIPVDNVSQRERFDADLLAAVRGVFDGYGGRHPPHYTVTARQMDNA